MMMEVQDMGYKLELDLPNVGKGVEVYLEGLGMFENPGEYEISDEQAEEFRVAHQVVTYHQDPDNGLITSTDIEPGPTVLQYFKDREGITVSTPKKATTKKAAAPQNKVPEDEDPGTVDEDDVPDVIPDGGPQSEGSPDPVVSEADKSAGDGSSNENKGGDQ
jgi:hypothetical protein